MTMDPSLAKMQETLESIEGRLGKLAEQPNTAVGVGDANTESYQATAADMFSLRRELMLKDKNEISFLIRQQAAKEGVGIPFQQWANAGGRPVQSLISNNELLTKALDTTGAAPLIRQDLEPLLYALFVKVFPAWDRFAKEPANGLVHAYNQVTSYGDAQFMTELGTVTDDVSVYERKTANVAIIATRRGISLRSQFAVQAGGMGWNPEQTELEGGLRSIAHRMQKTIFQGNASETGGTAATEDGLYDANSFDGLRGILNLPAAKNVDPTLATPENMRAAIDRASVEVLDAGGSVSVAYLRATDKTTFDLQQDDHVRYINNLVNVAPGVLTNAVNTVFGPLPLVSIPGDSIGTYAAAASGGSIGQGDTVADIYILDESTITLPYLGSDGPTVLEIPVGVSGQLTKLYILFGMWGLAVKALPFSNKIRVKQAS